MTTTTSRLARRPEAGLWGAVLGLAFAIGSCGGTITFVMQGYAGSPRPRETIAIVRSNGGSPTELVAVDGELVHAPLERDTRLHVEVLPGLHEVDVAAAIGGFRHVAAVRFLAEAGRVYRVEMWSAAGSGAPSVDAQWVAHAYEVDRDTDAVIATVDTPPPSVPTPPATAPRAAATPAPAEQASPPDAGTDAQAAEREGGAGG
ncbi:MAG TPA: hypothetical protein VE987_22875 [Polyangiaceae bacterium]|nr:hypothetical protein [Polyangiaceae bacterium]